MLKIAAAGATALCAGILCTTPYSLSVTPQGSVSLSLDSDERPQRSLESGDVQSARQHCPEIATHFLGA